jgi:hypothetical protein
MPQKKILYREMFFHAQNYLKFSIKKTFREYVEKMHVKHKLISCLVLGHIPKILYTQIFKNQKKSSIQNSSGSKHFDKVY